MFGFSVENDTFEVLDSDRTQLTNTVDGRMLDPDAMIESLDRFTAELVSQAEAANSHKECSKFTASITEGGNTWDDDSTDLTFPSISESAPNVVSIKSENIPATDIIDGLIAENEGHYSNDFSSINSSTMTASTLIEVEAKKLATVLRNQAEMFSSYSSIQSLDLDKGQLPSHLSSMSNSVNTKEFVAGSPKLVRRKKSLQNCLLVRRMLSNSLNRAGSLDSLENRSCSNIDQINPPSAMGDLDLLDLEGSMTSVSSIQSEISDLNPEEHTNPIFKVKQAHLFGSSYMSSITNLDNINPPSLFSEVTDMCNSLVDIGTEAIGSETEVFEDCNTHILQTEDDVTLFSDACSITPVQSDLESSISEVSPPKLNGSVSKRLTPKQRRRLANERYRTYVVAAEMVVSRDHIASSEDGGSDKVSESADSGLSEQNQVQGKLTPKERRKSDRERFQTHVLEQSVTAMLEQSQVML